MRTTFEQVFDIETIYVGTKSRPTLVRDAAAHAWNALLRFD